MVELTVRNDGEPVEVVLVARGPFGTREIELGLAKRGVSVYRVPLPDPGEECDVTLALRDREGRALCEGAVRWRPRRRWLVFLVQYSHHDLGYTDLPQRVLDEYVRFYDRIAELCEETEDWPDDVKFRYQVEQAWSVLHYLRTQPERKVERLARLLREGRIEVSALPGNMVSGMCGHEELIRLLYPAAKLRKEYGATVKVAELNDVPGLSWGLASVLAGSGIKVLAPLLPRQYYKPDQVPFWDERAVAPAGEPAAFWWVGIDGSRVLLWYQSPAFGRDAGFTEGVDKLERELPKLLDELEARGYPFDAVLIRVCGFPRDNSPPSLEPCRVAKEWNDKWAYPRIVVSTLSKFFDHVLSRYPKVLERLPSFRGEVPDSDYPVGATSTARATAVSREAKELMLAAERFATIADYVAGLDYPYREVLEGAREHSALYDEHTWGLCFPLGTAQECSRLEKELHAYKAHALAYDVLVRALSSIASRIDLPDDGYYVVVFNPLSWRRTDVVVAWLRGAEPCGHPVPKTCPALVAAPRALLELIREGVSLVDVESGEEVPCQVLRVGDPRAPLPLAAERVGLAPVDERCAVALLFVARDVPPLGYRVYKLARKAGRAEWGLERASGELAIENEYYRVALDPSTGVVSSLLDRELGWELVDGGARHGLGQVIVVESPTGVERRVRVDAVERGLRGPVAESLVARGRAPGCPSVVVEVTLYKGLKRVDFSYRILRDSTPLLDVYVAFPFNVRGPRFTYEGPCAVVSPPRDQLPGSHTCYYPVQHWVEVAGDGRSVALAPVDAHLVELGGLRPLGVSWAHHGARPRGYPSEELRSTRFERGHVYSLVMCNNFRTNFYVTQVSDLLLRYSITSYAGDWRTGAPRRHGWGVACPLMAVFVRGGQRGQLPAGSHSFCEVGEGNVTLTALKPSEDGKGLVVRLAETAGRACVAKVRLSFAKLRRGWLTNLIEEEVAPLSVSEDGFAVALRPFGIATVKLMAEPRLLRPRR